LWLLGLEFKTFVNVLIAIPCQPRQSHHYFQEKAQISWPARTVNR
jgi:hypothetical protein